MRFIEFPRFSFALVALALAAVAAPSAHAQLNPGDILLNNLISNVQRYSPAGTLLNTYTGTGTNYEGASVTPSGNIVTTRRFPTTGFNI